MQIRSSGSVKIISLDINKIKKIISASARELKRKDDNVLEVFLFGSLSKGRTVPGDDTDILIILSKSDKKIINRVTDFMDFFSGVGIGVDIFPYTTGEIRSFFEEENPLIKSIFSNKVKLA